MPEKSGRRIDLIAIWEKQRLSTAVSEALRPACKAAWEFLTDREGNVGEASKHDECWRAFWELEIETGEAWKTDLAANPIGPAPTDEEEALAHEWERLRPGFVGDARTIEGLEAFTNREWVRQRRKDLVAHYAAMPWDQLRGEPGVGLKKIRKLVEMLGIAAQG
jgi:hypothetical protein